MSAGLIHEQCGTYPIGSHVAIVSGILDGLTGEVIALVKSGRYRLRLYGMNGVYAVISGSALRLLE